MLLIDTITQSCCWCLCPGMCLCVCVSVYVHVYACLCVVHSSTLNNNMLLGIHVQYSMQALFMVFSIMNKMSNIIYIHTSVQVFEMLKFPFKTSYLQRFNWTQYIHIYISIIL